MAIVHIKTKEEFKSELSNSEVKVVVDFWAPWCGPCKMLGPIFEDISNSRDDFKFLKVNVDDVSEVASEFNIMSIPTILVFDSSNVVDTSTGALGKDQLNEFLDKNK